MLALGAVMAGVLVTWGAGLIYLSLGFERGDLAVPFLLVTGAAILIGRRTEVPGLALGMIAGAAAETAFFFYLFTHLP